MYTQKFTEGYGMKKDKKSYGQGGFKKPYFQEEEKQYNDPTEKKVKALKITGGKIILKLLEGHNTIGFINTYTIGQAESCPLIEGFCKIRKQLLELRPKAAEYLSKQWYWDLRLKKETEDGAVFVGGENISRDLWVHLGETDIKTENQLGQYVSGLNNVCVKDEEDAEQVKFEREMGLEWLLAPADKKSETQSVKEVTVQTEAEPEVECHSIGLSPIKHE